MRLLGFLVSLAAFAATALATPVEATLNATAIAERFGLDPNHALACENVGWQAPCDQLETRPDGSGFCAPITEGSVASRAKSFLLPEANRFPACQCRFFQQKGCTGLDSCYIADNRADSGCRYNNHSYWYIEDLTPEPKYF